MLRKLLLRFLMVAVALIATDLLVEYLLEVRDVARYMPGQDFAAVGDSRVRYRLMGVEHSGSPVVILSGMTGIIEQCYPMQSAISREVPTLSYDRGGYGFSQGSAAHTAEQQADELAGLLQALKIQKPVVIASYSASAQVARVFAGRYPEKTAGLYLIDPPMPEIDHLMPHPSDPRIYYLRWFVTGLLHSSVGYLRLKQWLSVRGPESEDELRVDAVVARRPHYWALMKEWYMTPVSARQTIAAAVPPTMPIEVVYPKRIETDKVAVGMTKAYEDLVARSTRGRLTELDYVDHDTIFRSGHVFDQMVERIQKLSQETAG